MRLAHKLTLLFCLFSFVTRAAEQIKGMVIDAETKGPMTGAMAENVDAHAFMVTDSTGNFTLAIARGQLIEFKKPGYRTQRWKVPAEGNIPPYFKVYLQKEVERPGFVFDGPPKSWKEDSTRYATIYANALKYPRMSTLDMINHPFSAMSKQSQQIWAFQEEYAMFQHEKYIDYTFNRDLVNKLTGLTGDSAAAYIRMYRPRYEQLRGMTEYDFFSYITRSVQLYRGGYDPKHPPSRTTN